MSGTPLLKHDTLFKLGLLSGEMQSLILSLFLQREGGVAQEEEGKKKGRWQTRKSIKKGELWEEKDWRVRGDGDNRRDGEEKDGRWRKQSFLGARISFYTFQNDSLEYRDRRTEREMIYNREAGEGEERRCRFKGERWKYCMKGDMDWDGGGMEEEKARARYTKIFLLWPSCSESSSSQARPSLHRVKKR